jgi:hypothetical protein
MQVLPLISFTLYIFIHIMYTCKTCARIYTLYRPPALQLIGPQIIDFQKIRQSVKRSCITFFNTGISFHYFYIPCGYHGTIPLNTSILYHYFVTVSPFFQLPLFAVVFCI